MTVNNDLPEVERNTTLYDYIHINEIINSNATLGSTIEEINDEQLIVQKILTGIRHVFNPYSTTEQIEEFVLTINKLINDKLAFYSPTNEIIYNAATLRDNLLVKINQLSLLINTVNESLNGKIDEIKQISLFDKDSNILNISLQEVSDALEYITTAANQIQMIELKINEITKEINNFSSFISQITTNQTNINILLAQKEYLADELTLIKDKLFVLETKTNSFINDTNVILNDYKHFIQTCNNQLNNASQKMNDIQSFINTINDNENALQYYIDINKKQIEQNIKSIENLQQQIDTHISEQYIPLVELVDNNTSEINANKNNIIDINTSIENIINNVNENRIFANDNINNIYSQINENKKEIQSIKEIDFINLTNRINKNKHNIEEVEETVRININLMNDTFEYINQMLKRLNDDLAANSENDKYQFENNSRAIHNLETDMQTVQNRLANLTEEKENINNDINTINVNVNDHTATITKLNNQFNQLNDLLDVLNENIGDAKVFNSNISSFKEDLNLIKARTYANDISIVNIKEKLANLDDQLNTLALSHENTILEYLQNNSVNLNQQVELLTGKQSIMTNSIDNINTNVANIYEKIKDIDIHFNTADEHITTVTNNIKELQSNIHNTNIKYDAAITNQKNSLLNLIQKNQNAINDINTEVSQNCHDIDVNQNNILEIYNKINEIEQKHILYDNILNTSVVSEIDHSINRINQSIEEINTTLNNNTYINQRFDLVSARINSLESANDTLQLKTVVSIDEPQNSLIWINPLSKTIKVKDENQWIDLITVSPVVTQEQILKDFIHVLTTVNDNDNVEGLDLLSIGTKEIASINMIDFINNFINDLTTSRLPIETFLLKKCNIVDKEENIDFVEHDLYYPRGNIYVDERLMKYEEINNILFLFPDSTELTIKQQEIVKQFVCNILPRVLQLIKDKFNLTFNINQFYLNTNNYYDLVAIPVVFSDSVFAPVQVTEFTCFTAIDEEDKKSHYANIILTENDININDVIDKILYAILQTNIYKYSYIPVSYAGETIVEKEIPKWFVDGINTMIYGANFNTVKTVCANFAYYLNNNINNKEIGFVLLKYMLKQMSLLEV